VLLAADSECGDSIKECRIARRLLVGLKPGGGWHLRAVRVRGAPAAYDRSSLKITNDDLD
jgi:hypothetical protein